MHRVNEASSSVLHIHEVKASYTEGKRVRLKKLLQNNQNKKFRIFFFSGVCCVLVHPCLCTYLHVHVSEHE